MDYFFGYFYREVNGMERILLRGGENKQWSFPISGFKNPGESIELSINSAIENFINHSKERRDVFLKANFLKPEIFKPEINDRTLLAIEHEGQNLTISPVFFKVKLENEIDPEFKGYFWVKKVPFFETGIHKNKKLCCGQSNLLKVIREDCVLNEFGLRVLECVDILVFREKDDGHEFLLLYRQKTGEKFGGWEYPKGGLKYHETIHEGAIREMLEETGIENIGDFRFGGYLGYQTADVAWRGKKEYNTLRVHGLTYLFVGRTEDIRLRKEEGHIKYDWTSWDDASEKIWVIPYGREFFERWKKRRWEIYRNVARPISLAFQVTEKCNLGCKFCLRRSSNDQTPTLEGMKEVIDILSKRGILRITFTGGEPLSMKKETLFAVIQYANQNRIYTCLSTRGLGLREKDIAELEGFLDHLLVSLHTLDEETASHLYDSIKVWEKLRKQMDLILQWTKNSKIIVEVSTVVTKKNIHQVIPIGEWLFRQNENLFWKIEEYYANGIQSPDLIEEFEVSSEEFKKFQEEVGANENLKDKLKKGRIRFSSKESREKAPDVMITPQGNLAFSANHEYEHAGKKLDLLHLEFKTAAPGRNIETTAGMIGIGKNEKN